MGPLFVAIVILHGSVTTALKLRCPEAPGAYYRAHPSCDFTEQERINRARVQNLLAAKRAAE